MQCCAVPDAVFWTAGSATAFVCCGAFALAPLALLSLTPYLLDVLEAKAEKGEKVKAASAVSDTSTRPASTRSAGGLSGDPSIKKGN